MKKTDILTGAFRQGSEENLVVFSDEYFEKVQDDWKKYNWITGDLVEEGEAEEASDDPSLADKACPFECEKCRLPEDRKMSSWLSEGT